LERLIGLACLAPSVGLSQPWRFVLVDTPARRAAVRANFEKCNAKALAEQSGERAAGYARLKLAGLDDAPGHLRCSPILPLPRRATGSAAIPCLR
jgi:5,6-dimethylbenzimidazole synthase